MPDHRHSSFMKTFQTFHEKRELRLVRCAKCHEILPYTQRLCQAHPNSELEWVEASGRARLHAYTEYCITYAPAYPAPYLIGMVELEEGPRLVSTIIRKTGRELRMGSELKADFHDDDRLVFVQVS